jgi:multiple RNA-binding domain-containing protein 1
LKRKRDSKLDPKNDEKLKQFLGVMQATAKTRTWQNEVMDGVENTVTAVAVAEAEDSSDDDIQTIESKKKKKPGANEPLGEDVEMEDLVEASAENADLKEKARSQSDKDWLRSKAGVLLDDDEDTTQPALEKDADSQALPEATEETEQNEQPVEDEPEATVDDTVEKIKKHGRLYLRNLPFTVTEADLRDKFGAFGELEEVRSALLFFLPPNCLL